MEKIERKRGIRKIIVSVCLILAAAVIAGYYLIPLRVLPEKYSIMECRYININGQKYDPKDGFPTEDQISRIEEILKKYKMKHTTRSFADDGIYGHEKLYMVFTFMDEKGVIIDSRGINVDKDMLASTRVRPFLDSLAVIENGETMYKEVMAVLGLQP